MKTRTGVRTAMGILAVLAIADANAQSSGCIEIVADEEYHCHYRPVPKDLSVANLVYLDTQTQWHFATNMYDPGNRGVAILEPLKEWGWLAGPVSVAPGLERILVARAKLACPAEPRPGPGLTCSYGAVIPWLAEHRTTADGEELWVHINLLKRYASPNASIHGWSSWLHRDLALFNGTVASPEASSLVAANCPLPNDSRSNEACDTQAYAIRFLADSEKDIVIEPFAKDRIWQPNALTGRLSAQPPRESDRCFDGQRLTIVRRHYDDPDLPQNWAWLNTQSGDGTGAACRKGLPSVRIPVLRTYVLEVDASCNPKRKFEELTPVRIPPDQPIHRQLSMDQEWGDMLSSISADGQYAIVASNLGDPARPDNYCAAFELNLRDAEDPLSGIGIRHGHVCRLGADGVCVSPPVALATGDLPPHTALPSFFTPVPARADMDRSIVYSFNWKTATVQVERIARVDLVGDQSVRHVVILEDAAYGFTLQGPPPEEN